ncbi:MAG: tetratricopeptide repeat protein [Flavobacteriaceae bacterium]|jgi:YaiO family outer membrane protein|nr:tetratricopeptide repeat protein [Flavobacteriaceae bacterium]
MKKNRLPYNYLRLVLALSFMSSVSYGQTTIDIDAKDNYFVAVNQQFKKGNWEAGKGLLDKGIKEYPNDSDLRMMLGKYYHQNKQYDKARYELSKAIELTPTNIDAKQILVNVEIETKRYSSAICYVNEILEVSPYLKSLWKKKIELFELQGNHVEASRLRKRLYQIYPTDVDLKKDYVYGMETEAAESRKVGDYDKSIEWSRKLVQESPNDASYYLVVINDYLKAGDKQSALSFTERGLHLFPKNTQLINKKVGILEEQKRYDELLAFLQANKLKKQYDYYVLEAARNAKLNDPFVLYSKTLSGNPGNEEAFNYVFTHLIATQQYEEALVTLSNYRRVKGASKGLALKELQVYTRMGNISKVNNLTKNLHQQYGNDKDIAIAYDKVILEEAKAAMFDEQYNEAISKWFLISNSEDKEIKRLAGIGLYNAYYNKGDYNSALYQLNQLSKVNTSDLTLQVKKSDIYFKQKNYAMALAAYEEIFVQAVPEQRVFYLKGYEDLCVAIVKSQKEDFLYYESLHTVKRWLTQDATNNTALKYASNLSIQVKKTEDAIAYLQKGVDTYPEDVFFKAKLAEMQGQKEDDYARLYMDLVNELDKNPYHELLLNTYASISEKYSLQLIKNNQAAQAIEKLDEALCYLPDSKELKYTKGLALEKQKKFAEAYYYQSFYEPGLIELDSFKQHLQFLNAKAAKNEVGMQYLLSRFEDDSKIRSIASFEYTRHEINNSYTVGVNYTGREEGKGVQGHIDWAKNWSNKFSTKLDIAIADAYFPKFAVNGSVFKTFNLFGGMEFELGAGYRKFQIDPINDLNKDSMYNIVIGATKETELFRLNTKVNNFFMGGEWMYNLSVNAKYYLSSPKNYITALVGVGSSPDVELIDYQLYNGFSVLNTNVGGGFGWMLYKNISANLLGTWYNYKAGDMAYKNLYNLYLTVHVVF